MTTCVAGFSRLSGAFLAGFLSFFRLRALSLSLGTDKGVIMMTSWPGLDGFIFNWLRGRVTRRIIT